MFKSGKKKEPKPKLLVRISSSLPREGVGAKSSVCPSKPRKKKTNFLAGSRDLAGISFEKKKLVFNFAPLSKKFHPGKRGRP